MRLVALSLKNYRQIPDFTTEISSHVVIVGANEAGKSSILRAINLTIGVRPAQLPASIQHRDFSDPARPIEIEVALGDLTADEEITFTDQVTSGVDGPRLRIKLDATISPIDDVVDINRGYPDFAGRRVSADDLHVISWRYVPASRAFGQDLSGQRTGALGRLLADVSVEDPRRFKVAAEAFKDAVSQVPELRKLRTALAKALDDSLPRTIAAADIDFVSTATLAENPLRDVALAVREGTLWVSLDEQSDGMQALATHALHVVEHARANIVGIDEPELHLHPPAQRSIGRLLSSAVPQQIIATNSPQVLSQFSPRSVLVLAPDRGVRKLPDGSPATASRFIARWWAEPVIEPLTAARLVAVEGVVDRLILRAAATAMGFDLDRSSVAVLDLQGANTITTIRRLYGPDGFNVPMYGLVDADHEEQWAEEFGVDVKGLTGVGVYTCTPDMEGQVVTSLGAERTRDLLTTSSLFSLNQVRTCAGDPPDPKKLVQFMGRDRIKMDAGIAVAAGLTAADASAITPLHDLLKVVMT